MPKPTTTIATRTSASARRVGRPKSVNPPPGPRNVIPVDQQLATELRAIGQEIGIPSVAMMVRISVRYVVKKLAAHEFQVVNGEIKPVALES